MKTIKSKAFLIFVIITLCTSFIYRNEITSDIDYANATYNSSRTTLNNNVSDTLKKKLVAEVHEYIKNTAPNAHNTISEHLVNHCLEHNVDICFVMAQTQNETNFGTMGVGRESSRRSLFGVYKKSYVDYKAAISDYFYILKGSYLVKGKTEQDLMKNYVNSRGARYASDRKYEVNLRKSYSNIKNNTNIHKLQNQYKSKQ